MMLKLIIKNIKTSLHSFRKVYWLMMISQLIAIISIFIAYGIFSSYSAKMLELDIESQSIGAYFSETEICTVGSLKNCLPEILDEYGDRLNYIFVAGADDDRMISMHSEYYNGGFHLSKEIDDKMVAMFGRKITDEDFINTKKVLFKIGTVNEEDVVNIGDEKFEIIGENGDANLNGYCIPFTSCPDKVELAALSVRFNKLPTQSDYLLLKNVLKENFGERVTIDEFEIKDEEELISIRSIIMISLAVGMISALNTCLLYGYIISKRRKQMAVYGIVGASKALRLAIQQLEIMLVSLAMELVGFLFFRFALQDLLTQIYESGISLYGTRAYVVMLTAYALCIFLITHIMLKIMNREKLTDMMRRTRND